MPFSQKKKRFLYLLSFPAKSDGYYLIFYQMHLMLWIYITTVYFSIMAKENIKPLFVWSCNTSPHTNNYVGDSLISFVYNNTMCEGGPLKGEGHNNSHRMPFIRYHTAHIVYQVILCVFLSFVFHLYNNIEP